MTLTDPVSPDLKRHLRTLKLGQLLATLPDRLTLARQNKLPHADFLELPLSNEVTRRENGSAARRARTAGLDPDMRTDTWDPTAAVRYDQQLWNELVSLRSGSTVLRARARDQAPAASGCVLLRARRPGARWRTRCDG